MSEGIREIAKNREASYAYQLLDRYEAGIVLAGTEVKSLRLGKANLKQAYVVIQNGEAIVRGMHIAPYEMGNRFNLEPLRPRTLLLHKSELRKLRSAVQVDGLTIVPTRLYFKNGKAKLEIAIARGKKLHDKRQSIKERDVQRELGRHGFA